VVLPRHGNVAEKNTCENLEADSTSMVILIAALHIKRPETAEPLETVTYHSNKTFSDPLTSLIMSVNLDNVQGDVWSEGFKKLNETYYFFRITSGKELDFSQSLGVLMKQDPPLISNLTEAKKRRDLANENHKQKKIAPIANALIAFSFPGLEAVRIYKEIHSTTDIARFKEPGEQRPPV
jgi:hypothetical protein